MHRVRPPACKRQRPSCKPGYTRASLFPLTVEVAGAIVRMSNEVQQVIANKYTAPMKTTKFGEDIRCLEPGRLSGTGSVDFELGGAAGPSMSGLGPT